MATRTTPHQHTPYSAHRDTVRCRCGAIARWGRSGTEWIDDGTRGCAVCAAPTTDAGDHPLCDWHVIADEQMTERSPAQLIADEIRAVVAADTLAEYVADESGHHSLACYESIVRTRLGGDYDPDAWDEAMDILCSEASA